MAGGGQHVGRQVLMERLASLVPQVGGRNAEGTCHLKR